MLRKDIYFCHTGRFRARLLVVGESNRGRTGQTNAIPSSTLSKLPRNPDNLSERTCTITGQSHRI